MKVLLLIWTTHPERLDIPFVYFKIHQVLDIGQADMEQSGPDPHPNASGSAKLKFVQIIWCQKEKYLLYIWYVPHKSSIARVEVLKVW